MAKCSFESAHRDPVNMRESRFSYGGVSASGMMIVHEPTTAFSGSSTSPLVHTTVHCLACIVMHVRYRQMGAQSTLLYSGWAELETKNK